MNISTVVIKPIISEKSVVSSGNRRRYTFVVDRMATKLQVKAAIQQQFGVKVHSVNTLICKGRTRRRTRSRSVVVMAPIKKAVVTLAPDHQITALEVKE